MLTLYCGGRIHCKCPILHLSLTASIPLGSWRTNSFNKNSCIKDRLGWLHKCFTVVRHAGSDSKRCMLSKKSLPKYVEKTSKAALIEAMSLRESTVNVFAEDVIVRKLLSSCLSAVNMSVPSPASKNFNVLMSYKKETNNIKSHIPETQK